MTGACQNGGCTPPPLSEGSVTGVWGSHSPSAPALLFQVLPQRGCRMFPGLGDKSAPSSALWVTQWLPAPGHSIFLDGRTRQLGGE